MIDDNDLNQKLRIMRFLWYNGYYTRLNIDIYRYLHGEKSSKKYTDIDAFGIKFKENLKSDIINCDCKSGRRANIKDRIFFASGLQNYINASQSIVIFKNVNELEYNDLCRKLNVTLLSDDRLSELEYRYKIESKSISGSFDKNNVFLEDKIFKNLKFVHKKAYNYIKSTYWYEKPNIQMSSLVSLLNTLDGIQFENDKYKQFIIIYTFSLLSISLLRVSESIFTFSEKEKEIYIKEMLFGGKIETSTAKLLFSRFYKFMKAEIMAKYNENYPVTEEEFIQFLSPKYVDDLIDLIQRITNNPSEATQIPRFLDIIAYECILKDDFGNIKEKLFSYNHNFDIQLVCKLTKNLIVFSKRANALSTESYDSINELFKNMKL